MTREEHIKFMRDAIAEAKKAADLNEVPVGAVAVVDGEVVMRAHNVREKTQNPLGHAEILLLNSLAEQMKSWRLCDVTVYVTCEPCPMCAGALLQARIPKLVYGCRNLESGACGSVYNVLNEEGVKAQISVTGGVLEDECVQMIAGFFKNRRDKK
jgi:tRNA(adenine34) deaminase